MSFRGDECQLSDNLGERLHGYSFTFLCIELGFKTFIFGVGIFSSGHPTVT